MKTISGRSDWSLSSAALLESCGLVDQVPDEDQIDLFTALTGPVPGFAAAFAAMLGEWACARGMDPEVADGAVRPLPEIAAQPVDTLVIKPLKDNHRALQMLNIMQW